MTTIRHMKELHKFNAVRSPDNRLRHSSSIWPVIVVLAILAVYAAPDFIAWARGDAPVVTGRMK